MNNLFRSALLLAAFLLFSVPTASAQVNISTSLFYGSPYVWRGEVLSTGFVLQPSVEASYGNFAVGFFGNLDPNGTASGDQFHFNEADLYASYGASVGGVAFGAGYTFYTFPTPTAGELELSPSHEIFASLGLEDFPIAPSVFVAYDFNAYEGLYAEAALGRDIVLGAHPFATGLALGFDSGYVLGDGEEAFSHLALTVGSDFEAGRLTVSPMAGFQYSISDTYQELFGETIFYGGIGVSF